LLSEFAMPNGLDDESFPHRACFPYNITAPTFISRRNAMTLAGSLRVNVCALVALGATAIVAPPTTSTIIPRRHDRNMCSAA
jgi:hypothetical protein